jgi:hypothetical protein
VRPLILLLLPRAKELSTQQLCVSPAMVMVLVILLVVVMVVVMMVMPMLMVMTTLRSVLWKT